MVETYTYFVYKDGNLTKARNGVTNRIDFSGTDAATVIQSAINAMTNGGKLIIADGIYALTSGLSVNNANIKIEGFGTAVTQLSAINNLNADMITINSSNIHLRDFSIYGNKTNQTTGKGIKVTSPTNLIMDSSFDRLEIKNCKGDGLFLDSTIINLRMTNILAELNDNDGFNINGSDHYFNSCESRSNSNFGWELTGSSHELVSCAGSGNLKTGIVAGSFRSDFIGCFVDRNYEHGMYLSGDLNSVIGGHYYYNNKANSYFHGITIIGKKCKVNSTRIGESPYGGDTQQHQYNLSTQSTADNTIIANNTLISSGATLGNFLDQGTNTIINNNFGFSDVSPVNKGRGKNTTYTNSNNNRSLVVYVIIRCQITSAGGKATAQMKADTSSPPTTPITGEFGIQSGILNEDNSIAMAIIIGPGLNYRLDTIETNGTLSVVSWFETFL